jgi:glucosyl-3-phosphoglycerate synthase
MGDFYQNGIVTTLHNLVRRPVEDIEADLKSFQKARPMSLVLPSLYSELEGPALKNIVQELTHVPYLSEIVIGLDRANEQQYRHALEYFSDLPQPFRVLWNDGPRLKALDQTLREQNLAPTEMGKGRNVCIASVMCWLPGSVNRWHCMIAIFSPIPGICWPG